MNDMDTSRDASHRGLLKLMLRLPALRDELQLIWPSELSLRELCEAYEQATLTFDRFITHPGEAGPGIIEEYRLLCRELETDVTARCLASLRSSNRGTR